MNDGNNRHKGTLVATDHWRKNVNQRLKWKFQEIKEHLADVLGPNVDIHEETQNVIDVWEENVESQPFPAAPECPLQHLLREYHNICEEMLDDSDKQFRAVLLSLERAAAAIRHQVTAEFAASAGLSEASRDYVIEYLFGTFIFDNPEVLAWLGRQRRPLSVKLNTVLHDWIANPERR